MPVDYCLPSLPLVLDFETKDILKQLNKTNKQLAELKGIVQTIPNEEILISTLTLQEAKESSEVENIVTTQDDLFKYELRIAEFERLPAAKEVLRYREAILLGFREIRKNKILTNNIIQDIQAALIGSAQGFRKIPGTELRSLSGEVIYRPPQDGDVVLAHMKNLEEYLNAPAACDVDPLVRLAIVHHQFESIHPFYDGNGRTGRIICVLFLVLNNLLDLPILYLSRYITQTKNEYYRTLQDVRDGGGRLEDWQAWILYILRGIEVTAQHTIAIVKGIRDLMAEYKGVLRPAFGKVYHHEMLNHLFCHPYTKIEYMQKALSVQRLTAAKYLDKIVELGLLKKVKVGRTNYYINQKFVDLFVNHEEIAK